MADLRELGTLALLVVGLVCLFLGVKMISRTLSIYRSGGVSAGMVVGKRVHREDALVTVRFSTAQNKHVQFEQLAPLFHRREYKVLYDKVNPQRATITPRLNVLYGLFLVGFGMLFITETYANVFLILTD